jgi:DNA-directed RNA polymerase specialized sigma24 family protein
MVNSQPTTDERDLLERWRAHGDQQAAAMLWRRHTRLAVAIAARVLREAPTPLEEAREIADERFVHALRTWDAARASSSAQPFRAWYMTLVRNAAIDRRRALPAQRCVDDEPEASEDPTAALHDAIALRTALPRIRRWLLEHYLPSDMALFEEWMRHQRDGSRVPWSTLAERFVVEIDDVVPFPTGTALPTNQAALQLAARTLRLCPKIQVRVRGTATTTEPPVLADRRLDAVLASLRADLNPLSTRAPDTGALVPRLVGETSIVAGPPRVEFAVTIGRVRSPDALRMRVTKVLLPGVREMLSDPPTRGRTP